MTITARYRSRCTRCGQQIQPGETIEWRKGHGSLHITCPEPREEAATEVQMQVASPNWIATREAAMLQAGRLNVTLDKPTEKRHLTLFLKCRVKNGKWEQAPFERASHVFIATGKGGDTVATYYPSKGTVRVQGDEVRANAAVRVIEHLTGVRPLPAGFELVAADECGRCGRRLTDPESIARGIGPECYGKETGQRHVRAGGQSARRRNTRERPKSFDEVIGGNRDEAAIAENLMHLAEVAGDRLGTVRDELHKLAGKAHAERDPAASDYAAMAAHFEQQITVVEKAMAEGQALSLVIDGLQDDELLDGPATTALSLHAKYLAASRAAGRDR